MGRRWVAAGAIVGTIISAGVVRATSEASRLPLDGPDLYQRVASAAAAGDPRAQEQLSAIDVYLGEMGLGPESLTLPVGTEGIETFDPVVQLRVEDFAPWRLDVDNTTTFATPESLEAYRAARHASLEALASQDPNRRIEVAISPRGGRTLSEVSDALAADATGLRLLMDVYAESGWLMSGGYGIEGRSLREADVIESEFVEMAAVSIDQWPGTALADLRTEVRSICVVMAAADALAASHHDAIYAVDPLTDIEDAFVGRAAIVDVRSAPDLRGAHARLVLRSPIDSTRVNPEGSEP